MANVRFPRGGDKVKIINCKVARANEGKIFTVKASPYVVDRKIVVLLKEKRGYFEPKNLEIVEYA